MQHAQKVSHYRWRCFQSCEMFRAGLHSSKRISGMSGGLLMVDTASWQVSVDTAEETGRKHIFDQGAYRHLQLCNERCSNLVPRRHDPQCRQVLYLPDSIRAKIQDIVHLELTSARHHLYKDGAGHDGPQDTVEYVQNLNTIQAAMVDTPWVCIQEPAYTADCSCQNLSVWCKHHFCMMSACVRQSKLCYAQNTFLQQMAHEPSVQKQEPHQILVAQVSCLQVQAYDLMLRICAVNQWTPYNLDEIPAKSWWARQVWGLWRHVKWPVMGETCGLLAIHAYLLILCGTVNPV